MYPVVNLGQGGPLGDRWWAHHIGNTRAYLEASLAGDTPRALQALAELWNAVLSWQQLTKSPTAGLLMAEHTALAKLLIDGFAEGKGGRWTGTAADALAENVKATSILFPIRPQEFGELFGQHVQITGQYITDLAAGDRKAFDAHYAQAVQNGRNLGAFTDRYVVGALV